MTRPRSALLGVDLGTTAVKAAAFTVGGELLATARRATPVTRFGSGLLEHDAGALMSAAFDVMRECTERLPGGCRVEGIAAASMGEAGTVVDGDGAALRPVIAWFDTRAGDEAAWWESEVGAARIYELTGQTLDPNLGAHKLLWVRGNEPDVFARARKWLSAPDLLVRRLSGREVTDLTIASRTMLLDRRRRDWSEELLDAAGIDRELLPEVAAAGTQVGGLLPDAADAIGLPAGTPVSLGGHDHLCAAFAARGGEQRPVDSTGTAEGLVTPVAAPLTGDPGLKSHVSCYPDVVPGAYVLSAQVGLAGGLVEWLARAAFRDAGGEYEQMFAEVPQPLRFSGVICHPVFGRGASPWWDPAGARGAFLGLTIATTDERASFGRRRHAQRRLDAAQGGHHRQTGRGGDSRRRFGARRCTARGRRRRCVRGSRGGSRGRFSSGPNLRARRLSRHDVRERVRRHLYEAAGRSLRSPSPAARACRTGAG